MFHDPTLEASSPDPEGSDGGLGASADDADGWVPAGTPVVMKTRSARGPVSMYDENAAGAEPWLLRGHSARKCVSLPQMLHFITCPSEQLGFRFRSFPFPEAQDLHLPCLSPLPKKVCSTSSSVMSARKGKRELPLAFSFPPLPLTLGRRLRRRRTRRTGLCMCLRHRLLAC